MLTRDLLIYRVRGGRVIPSFIDSQDASVLAVAEGLLAIAASGVGMERAALAEQTEEQVAGFQKPKVAQGLLKILFDRMEFEEPSEEVADLRRQTFDAAARVLRGLRDDCRPDDYESGLAGALPEPLEALRSRLYADHPENRRMIAWEELTARELLDRYNMAQVQGLILRSQRLSLRAASPDLLRVRKVLRCLKFNRLVPEVHAVEPDLFLEVEGPGAILSMGKKYGLQLAQFVAAVPILERYEIRAEVTFDRRPTVLLVLDEKSGLVAPHAGALGFVPPEIEVILKKLEEGPWEVDRTPQPRPVGATGLCVPDIGFRRGAEMVAVEFFHPWHRPALARRLADLRSRADPRLILAVDEKLLKEDLAEAASHPQVLLFRGFPSERALREILIRRFEGDRG